MINSVENGTQMFSPKKVFGYWSRFSPALHFQKFAISIDKKDRQLIDVYSFESVFNANNGGTNLPLYLHKWIEKHASELCEKISFLTKLKSDFISIEKMRCFIFTSWWKPPAPHAHKNENSIKNSILLCKKKKKILLYFISRNVITEHYENSQNTVAG